MVEDDYADDAFAGDEGDGTLGTQVLPSADLADTLTMIGDLGKTGSQTKLHATVHKKRSPRKPLSQRDKLVKKAYRVLNKAQKAVSSFQQVIQRRRWHVERRLRWSHQHPHLLPSISSLLSLTECAVLHFQIRVALSTWNV